MADNPQVMACSATMPNGMNTHSKAIFEVEVESHDCLILKMVLNDIQERHPETTIGK